MMSTSLRLMVRVRVRASSTVADGELAESRKKNSNKFGQRPHALRHSDMAQNYCALSRFDQNPFNRSRYASHTVQIFAIVLVP